MVFVRVVSVRAVLGSLPQRLEMSTVSATGSCASAL